MWHHFQSLRFKLATLYVVVFGIVLTALGLTALTLLHNLLQENFDQLQINRAEAMVRQISIDKQLTHAQLLTRPDQPRFNPFRFPGYYMQIRLFDGSVIERTPNMGQATLPFSDLAISARQNNTGAILEFLDQGVAQAINKEENSELRLLTIFEDRPDTQPYYLQIAVNLKRVTDPLERMQRIFVILIASALILAVTISWLWAHYYLAPIAQIPKAAENITANNLQQRFSAPSTENEITVMVRAINQLLDRLEQAFRSQERFIADVSHELKTPLSILLSESQVLAKGSRRPEELEKFAADVQEEVRKLVQTIDRLMMLSRAESGLPISLQSNLSLNEIVMDAVERCRKLAEEQEVRLVPQLAMTKAEENEPHLQGDSELLCLSFVNLLRNAIHHSLAGAAVDIKVSLEENEATVTVRDRGPGIPTEYLDQIFDRFFRVPNSTSNTQGMGIGLTIVRGVTRLHGGKVSVTNRSDGGCEFRVRLPLARNG